MTKIGIMEAQRRTMRINLSAKSDVHTSWDARMAQFMLVSLILAIAFSPRFRFPFIPDRNLDLRLQDLLIVPALLLVRRHGDCVGMRWLWGRSTTVLCWLAITLTFIHAIRTNEPSLEVRVAFLGRGLEPFCLAVLTCRLAALSGASSRLAERTIFLATAGNLAWVGYQFSTGTKQTLLGRAVGDQIFSYGPKLIGEASAFGTGAFFAFASAFAVAQIRARVNGRALYFVVLGATTVATYLSESRIWLGAIGTFIFLLVVRSSVRSNILRGLWISAALLFILAVASPSLPDGSRFTEEGVDASMGVRESGIWAPLIDLVLSRPVFAIVGVGPGGIGATGISEAHNFAMRAIFDYGLIGTVVLLICLGRVLLFALKIARNPALPSSLRSWAELAMLSIVGLMVAGLVQDSFTAVTSSHLVMLSVGLLGGSYVAHLRDWGELKSDQTPVDAG